MPFTATSTAAETFAANTINVFGTGGVTYLDAEGIHMQASEGITQSTQ